MYDVISIGSATLDIFVKSNQFKVKEDKDFPSGLALCEAYGAKIEIEEVHMASGGGGTNSAVSFSRMGLRTACIAEMGKDLAARTVLHELVEERVDTSMMIQEQDENTGVSVIMIAPEGGRSIVTCRGAAAMLGSKDIHWDNLLKTRWLYISSLGGQVDLLRQLLSFSQKNKIKVALNPGEKELEVAHQIKDLCGEVEVLVLNLEEAARYLDMKEIDEHKIIKRLKEEGGKLTLVTNGNKGAYIIDGAAVWACEPGLVKAVETTGAGDAFGSGFVSGQILGWGIEKSAQLAVANAEAVIQKFGAKEGLLKMNDFEKSEIPAIKKIV